MEQRTDTRKETRDQKEEKRTSCCERKVGGGVEQEKDSK